MSTLRHLLSVLIVLSLSLGLSGCASLLTAADSEAIEDDSGERTFGASMDDESIETKARVNVHAANEAFDDTHISIISYNAYVLIVGQVPSEALKQQASDVIREIRRVRRIYNELEITGNTSFMTRTSDTWITSKVKTNLIANAETEGLRVKVVTENGVVYLMGLASRAEADRIVDVASASYGVRKVVRLFEYID
ncbi:BON domain-containing protein [Halieaceae bacterium IMCC14734]|uniref:BON domain-containing protein n=1 Tax=Candidatus Litorirhabdus singularis TaxID=2518993 RepID=A0ABT3TJF1_9GAMM|nr:BON domain-containing protein [Candidatus Litorirhabdus singularis]MCX2982416.1 BON domain-containing protein [Candidatus Litorirhabdus singularis]